MSDGGGNDFSLSDKVDVFDEVIGKLKTASKTLEPLVDPLDEATSVLSDVIEVLDDIKSFKKALDSIDDVLKVVTRMLPALAEIPAVGPVIAGFNSVLKAIEIALKGVVVSFKGAQKELIDPVYTILKKVEAGMSEVRTVLMDLSQKLPEFLNTIQILSYLARIVIALSEILQGTEVYERLRSILSELDKVKTKVMDALNHVTMALHGVEQAVKFINVELRSFCDSIGNRLKEVLDGFKDAAHVLNSIKHVFDKILDVWKPLKWNLEVQSKIFKKVIEPAIDEILKVTKLKGLIKSASEEVLSKLEISQVFDLLRQKLNVINLEAVLKVMDPTNSEAFSNYAKTLFLSLEKYKGHGVPDSPVSKIVMDELLSAITGTPIDPNKPAIIPPFPRMPGFSDGGSAEKREKPHSPVPTNSLPSAEEQISPVSLTPYSARRNMNLQKLFAKVGCVGCTPISSSSSSVTLAVCMSAGSNSVTTPSNQDASVEDLPNESELCSQMTVDLNTWPQCARALTTIERLTANVESFSPTITGLANSMDAFKSALQLLDTFQDQMKDLVKIFSTADNLMKLLITFDVKWITLIVAPAKNVLANQKAAAQGASSDVPNLTQAVKDVTAAAESVTDVMIGDAAKSNVLLNGKLQRHFIGWSLAIRQFVAMFQEGRKRDPNDSCDGTTYGAKLDEMAVTLESSVSSLNERLSSIDQGLKTVNSNVQQMMEGLSDFSTQLKTLSSHSNVIGTKALPSVRKAAHILGIIDSVIDPLTSLLKAQHCFGSDAKSHAWNTIQLLVNDGSKAFVESSYAPAVFEQIAKMIADEVLPLGALKADVDSATKILSNEVQKTFESKSNELLNALQSIVQNLEETKFYTVEKHVEGQPTVKETITNDFVAEQNVADIEKLLCKSSDA